MKALSIMKEVTDQTFDQVVLANPKLVLVDFWAEWCAPCILLTATLESVLQDRQENMEGFILDVEGNQEVAARYGIRGMPTVMLFRQGKEVARIVGNKSKTTYEAAIASQLGGR